ncbi:AzlC family ABC transporter permease [Marihabitans asiaticum]|uniref:AzlC family ABC transporter permease n=1 Tax=Marihabitans asiaticum TaxID=415218 RepID=UPI00119D8A7C|nr:AzlC family ABC transporter permease [Marihabitans asiaticum]
MTSRPASRGPDDVPGSPSEAPPQPEVAWRSLLSTVRASPALQAGLSIAIAIGPLGISFGALGTATGLSMLEVCALSLLTFSGGSQFAFIGVLAGGGSPASALGASTLLGLRNGVYGMQINTLLHPQGWRRLAAAQVTIDESTATALAQEERVEQARGFWSAGLGIFVMWNATTLVGAVVGEALGDARQWGLDGAAAAAFLGLLWPRLRAGEPMAIAACCAVVTAVSVPLLPPGVPILVAAAVAALIGWSRLRRDSAEAAAGRSLR